MKYASYSLLLFWKNAQQITTATKLNYPFCTSTSQHTHIALYQSCIKARYIKPKQLSLFFRFSYPSAKKEKSCSGLGMSLCFFDMLLHTLAGTQLSAD